MTDAIPEPVSGPVLDEDSLAGFLEAFYARVRRDPLIGPVFAAAIPDADWPRHMAVIWLGLFETTARERFAPGIAAALVERAHRIGDSLKAGLFFRPDRP